MHCSCPISPLLRCVYVRAIQLLPGCASLQNYKMPNLLFSPSLHHHHHLFLARQISGTHNMSGAEPFYPITHLCSVSEHVRLNANTFGCLYLWCLNTQMGSVLLIFTCQFVLLRQMATVWCHCLISRNQVVALNIKIKAICGKTQVFMYCHGI